MEIKVTGTPDEIKKLLNANKNSIEQLKNIGIDVAWLRKRFTPMDPKAYRQKLQDVLGKGNSSDRN